MTDKIDLHLAMRVFQHVLDNGERTEGGHAYRGLIADPGVDGYTVTLSDGAVTLAIMFHQSFSVDSPGHRATDNFIKKLEAVYTEIG